LSAEYKLIARSAAGAKQADVRDFLWLSYSKRRRKAGLLRFALSGRHSLAEALARDWQLEVWRRNRTLGIEWYCDFYALFADTSEATDKLKVCTYQAPGQMSLLARRDVAWKAGTAGRTAFAGQPGETVMKTLVAYNATALATTGAGRVFDGTFPGQTITVEADGAGGNGVDWACAWANLLDNLGELARIAGGDFDLIKTGPAAWEFRWYAGQRGVDRSSTVIFSTTFGNMIDPTYEQIQSDERTVAIVGGSGEGAARVVETRTGVDWAADRSSELFVDRRSDTDLAVLDAAGDDKLDGYRAREKYGFKVEQTLGSAYGRHYCVAGAVGDRVTVRQDSRTAVQVIDWVDVGYGAQHEQINVVMADP